MSWIDLVSSAGTYSHLWAAIGNTIDDWQNADFLGTTSDGVTLRMVAALSGTEYEFSGSSLSAGVPVHLAVVRESATSLKLYTNGSLEGTITQSVSGRSSTGREQIGTLNMMSCRIRLVGIKQWQAGLTIDEVKAEMRAIRPLRFANLHSWHPAIANNLTDALKDFSGNGRNWTSQGTNTVETPSPPVSWGARAILIIPSTGGPPQLLAPASDVSAGGWTPSSGSDLYAMLDETSYSDTDYIVSSTASVCTLALAAGSDPAVSTGHILRYRMLSGVGSVSVALKQNTTTIASWGPHALTTSAQDFAQTLTGGQADSITDYSALRVEFTAN
jgi:hypothetical protein